mmetsp:Transcript_65717/g.155225  ORF Transcript_65717/g.155225 Transcript_65717/m.155225 type:complete len:319 (+) Transcript_65717:1-957(+)
MAGAMLRLVARRLCASTVGRASLFPNRRNMSNSPSSVALNTIIKVYAVSSPANHFMPWQAKQPQHCTGSGFVCEGNRILTNAHVVADQTHVTVRKHGDATRYVAEVKAVGHACDLAELTVNDPAFWQGIQEPLPFGGIPNLQDPVTVFGYPTGGDNISVTMGVVSRVELQRYSHAGTQLLAVQIDAAINSGNSGGPAIMDNEVVGVAFQNLDGAENIGFIIPTDVVSHFLNDPTRHTGKSEGLGQIGISCQTMENPELRSWFGMDAMDTGVLVKTVDTFGANVDRIQRHDIVLEIDGHKVENDGSFQFRKRSNPIHGP